MQEEDVQAPIPQGKRNMRERVETEQEAMDNIEVLKQTWINTREVSSEMPGTETRQEDEHEKKGTLNLLIWMV